MKINIIKTISVWLVTMFLTFNIKAETIGGWPYTGYTYAKIYLYNLSNNYRENQNIIVEGKLNKSVIGDGYKIENIDAQNFIKYVNKNISGLIEGLSKTFIPHHAVVFYNDDDKPIANIIFSFDGQIIKTQPAINKTPIAKELSDKEIERLEKILEEFKTIFVKYDFPVFNSIFDYPKYLEQIRAELPIELELNKEKPFIQLIENQTESSKKRFDLSGLAHYDSKILAIADKEWNSYIYQIDTSGKNFQLTELIPLKIKPLIDLESIDCMDKVCFITDESAQKIYKVNMQDGSSSEIILPWQKFGYNPEKWENAGLEGLALKDSKTELFVAKERDPGKILKLSLLNDSISEPFDKLLKPIFGNNDFSDLKIENNYLYILHRQPCGIIRIDLLTNEIKRWSYKKSLNPDGQKIHDSYYQTAEALLILPNEIWIGIDNNETPVTPFGEKLGLQQGDKAVIFIFQRPKDF